MTWCLEFKVQVLACSNRMGEGFPEEPLLLLKVYGETSTLAQKVAL